MAEARAAGSPPVILIIAENGLWLEGLKEACRGLGRLSGWTAVEWLRQTGTGRGGGVPDLLLHHRGEAPVTGCPVQAEVTDRLRGTWPGVRLLTIADAPDTRQLPSGIRLPQSCSVDGLRSAVRQMLSAA